MTTDAPTPPAVLAGRYRMVEMHGCEQAGAVWRAIDELLDREVAVTRVRLDAPGEDTIDARERTLREARIAAQLHHPNVVTVFGVVESDGLWLVLEYVASRRLADVLAEHGPPGERGVQMIGEQLAAALAAAHVRGIVHGGLTPADVLLVDRAPDAGATVKVTGWGLAGPDEVRDSVDADRYRAPEVVAGESPGAAADLYACGAILTELLGGDVGAVRTPRDGSLAGLAASLVVADPAARPDASATYRTLRALRAAEQQSSVLVPVADAPDVTPDVAAGPVARRWWTRRSVLLVAAGLLAVGVAAGLVSGRDARGLDAVRIDDPRTADPCSMIDLAPLERFGVPELVTDLGWFNDCQVDIRPPAPAGGLISVVVSLEAPVPPGLPQFGQPEMIGAVRLARFEGDETSCVRRITLVDGSRIALYESGPADPAVDHCAVAEAAARDVLDRLDRAGITEREPLDTGSVLAGIDPCSLLDPVDLAVVPGFADAPVYPGFADAYCNWDDNEDPQRDAVLVLYNRELPLDDDDGSAVDLAGRTGRLSPLDDYCKVTVEQRGYASGDQRRAETVSVYVYGPQVPDARCVQATVLARAVVAKLPPP